MADNPFSQLATNQDLLGHDDSQDFQFTGKKATPTAASSASSSAGHFAPMFPVADDETGRAHDVDDCTGPLVPFKLPHRSSLKNSSEESPELAAVRRWLDRDKKFRLLIRNCSCLEVAKMLAKYPRLAWTCSYAGSLRQSALRAACQSGSFEIFHLIYTMLKKRDPKFLQNKAFEAEDTSLLHAAAHSGNYQIFKTLLDDEHSQDMFELDTARVKKETLTFGSCGCGQVTHDHSTPKTVTIDKILHSPILHEAAKSGNVRIVAEVLSRPGCDINAESGQGMTALHWAIFDLFASFSSGNKSLDIIAFLLARGADVNHRTKLEKPTTNWVDFRETFGMSPLQFALAFDASKSRSSRIFLKNPLLPQLVRMLLAHGAEVDSSSTAYQTRTFQNELLAIPSVPLIANAQALGIECYVTVLGENMLHLAGPAWTPLHVLCSRLDPQTPAFEAARQSMAEQEVIQWLGVSHEGFGSPLHVAVRLQRLLLVHWLLPHWTAPIDIALLKLALPKKATTTNVFDVLFERYHLPEQEPEREEALHDLLLTAISARSLTVVKRLLYLGASPTLKDYSAIVAAWQTQNVPILRSLVRLCSKAQVNAAFPLAFNSRKPYRLRLGDPVVDVAVLRARNDIFFEFGVDWTQQSEVIAKVFSLLEFISEELPFLLALRIFQSGVVDDDHALAIFKKLCSSLEEQETPHGTKRARLISFYLPLFQQTLSTPFES